MVLESKRLILRNWKIEDAESMYKYAKDPDVGPIAGWPAHDSIDVSKSVINEFINNHPYCFAICLKDDVNHPIGCIELKQSPCDLTDKTDESELGFWLGKSFWGNEYMLEASKRIIDFGFNDLKLNAIWCGYYDGNNKSKRVQEKIGFIFHHTCHDADVPLLNEVRIGHVNYMSKDMWNEGKEKV